MSATACRMSDLVAFLNARLDEDEAAAKCVLEDPDYEAVWHEPSSSVLYVGPGSERYPLDGLHSLGDSRLTRFIAEHDPARVLREVEAGRRLLARWEQLDARRSDNAEDEARAWLADEMVAMRAAVYADHPDYDQGWA